MRNVYCRSVTPMPSRIPIQCETRARMLAGVFMKIENAYFKWYLLNSLYHNNSSINFNHLLEANEASPQHHQVFYIVRVLSP